MRFVKVYIIVLLSLLLLSLGGCTEKYAKHEKDSVIPPELIGVWVEENSTEQYQIVTKGAGIYLLEDGRGAVLETPPPIGFGFLAKYNSVSNVISFHGFDNAGTAVEDWCGNKIFYDPIERTLKVKCDITGTFVFVRKYDSINQYTMKSLGLDMWE